MCFVRYPVGIVSIVHGFCGFLMSSGSHIGIENEFGGEVPSIFSVVA